VTQNWNSGNEAAEYCFRLWTTSFCKFRAVLLKGPEPKDYKEAMSTPARERQKWCKSMCKIFENMESKQVWILFN
jgi:hypothetical protein